MLGKDGIRPWIGLPLLDKFLTVRVGRKSIRPRNAYDNGQMIHPPGTRRYVFNRYIPKRDTCLLDTYLSNPILSEDLIPH